MLHVSDEVKELYKQDSVPKSYSIFFPDLSLTITNPQLVSNSFSLTEDLFTENSVCFGACVSNIVKFTVADVTQDLTGHTFTIIQNIGGEQVPLGAFVVDSCIKQKSLRFKDITAYDIMTKIEVDVADWYNSLFPTGGETYTLAQFRTSFLAHVGLEEDTSKLPLPNDSMIIEKTISVSQLSGRTVIEAIEEINGCFGHINREGKFTHIILKPAYGLYPGTFYPGQEYPRSETDNTYVTPSLIDETITVGMRESIKFEEYTVKEITKLIIRQDDDDIGAIITADKGAYLETLTGTSLSSTKTEDAGEADITRIEGNYAQTVTVQGKNLVAGSTFLASTQYNSCVLCFANLLPNTQYTISLIIPIGELYYANENLFTANPYTTVGDGTRKSFTVTTKATISINDNTQYAASTGWRICKNASGYSSSGTASQLQIELGSTSTAYAPFVPNSPSPDYPSPITFPVNFNITASNGTDSNSKTVTQEIRKLPNGVMDTIEKVADTRFKNRVGKVVLNGTEVFGYISISMFSLVFPSGANNIPICTHYTGVASSVSISGSSNSIKIQNGFIYIKDGRFTDVTAFKTWLAANPITVYYELATPTETVIEDITLDTYKGLTNITTNSTPQVSITASLYGNTNNSYIIEDNFLVYGKSAEELENIGRNIFGYIAKRPHRPYDSTGIGLPYVEVGDMLKFDQDDPVAGYVFGRTLTGIQGLRDNFKASGSEEQTQNFGLNYEIQQLKGRTARIVKTVDEVSVTLTDLSENVDTSFSVVHGQITAEVNRATAAEGTLSGQVTVMAGEVNLKVAKNEVIASINLSPETIKIEASNIQLEGIVTVNSYFKILADGSMEAVNGKFSGQLVAATGSFSGAITGGSISIGSRFAVDSNGYLTASGAIFTDGKITSNGSGSKLEIEGATLNGYNSSGGLILNITAGGTVNAVTVTAPAMICNTINGYTPLTIGNYTSYCATSGHTHTSLYDGVAKVTAFGANFRPHSDTGSNVISCGSPSYLWTQVFAATPVISTSDETLKQQGVSLSDAERRVAIKIKNSIKTFKFNDAVNTKGDQARKHTGVYAQEVRTFFEEEGLVVDNYALFCSDTWYEKDGKAVGEGEIPYTADDEGTVPVTRLGIRYEELLCFIIASL